MRCILVLINNTNLGGAERRLGRIFTKLARDSPNTCLVVNRLLWERLLSAGIVQKQESRVWLLPEPCLWVASHVGIVGPQVRFWIKKLDYVVFAFLFLLRYGFSRQGLFHVALGGTYAILGILLVRPSHRVVISVTNPVLENMVGSPTALKLYHWALARCRAIDVLTETIKENLVRQGIREGKIFLSNSSIVDGNHFKPFPEKNDLIVFAGRFIEEKNPLLFLDAIPEIRRALPTVKFLLLGEGPLLSQIKEKSEQELLCEAVEVRYCPDLAPVLAQARIFVSLQRTDNYPSQSLLEAMSCEAVPVATDVGSTWRLVDENTGIRIKPDSPSLAKAVVKLMGNMSWCGELGRAARKRVVTLHTEERFLRYLNQFYMQVSREP